MKVKKVKSLIIALVAVLSMLFLVSCGSDGYMLISETDENIEILYNSDIGSMLQNNMFEDEKRYNAVATDFNEPIEDLPWLIVREEKTDGKTRYVPIATSEKSFDNSTIGNIKILAVYTSNLVSAIYVNSTGGRVTVSSEYVDLKYFSLEDIKQIGYDHIAAKELPNSTSGNREYEIEDSQIANTLINRIESQIGFRYKPDAFIEKGSGKLSEVDLEKIYNNRKDGDNILYIPKKFTKICQNAFGIHGSNYNSKWDFDYFDIPDSITEIEEDAWPNTHGIVLFVGHNSYAENWAKENGVMYAYKEEPIIVYVPENVDCWYMPLSYIEIEKYCFTDSTTSISEYSLERLKTSNYGFKIEAPKGSFIAKVIKENAPNYILVEK